MASEYLKKASRTPASGEQETRRIVSEMLAEIRNGGEKRAREYGVELSTVTTSAERPRRFRRAATFMFTTSRRRGGRT
jgi:hypothetical protein